MKDNGMLLRKMKGKVLGVLQMCRNTWNNGGNSENDVKYSEEEEY